jgi:hypothetical protein
MLGGGRVAILLLLIGWCAPALAAPAADRREVDAREAFVTGRYQQALDLYGKLYAETLHPTYLRNIGRCYQQLREPDQAISTFRSYLRKAAVPAPERAEIEEYIAEMESLKREQAEKARPVRLAPRPEASPPPMIAVRPEPTPPPQRTPTRWWLWTGLAAVGVAAAVTAGVLLTRPADASCPMGITCYRP